MKNSKREFPEGTWFAIPLRDGGYCRGLVARTTGKGRALGYFFGPKKATIEELPDVSSLLPIDAILVGRFGDLGLLNGEWKVIKKDAQWDRATWPIPPFITVDVEAKSAMKTIFNDNLEIISYQHCDPSLADQFPKDGLMGYRFVEIMLTRLLSSSRSD